MLPKDFLRHAAEFLHYLRRGNYEHTGSGVLFPVAQTKVVAKGTFFHSVNGEEVVTDFNTLTDEGITHLLETTLAGGSQIGSWHLALFGNNVTPSTTLTAASFPASLGEITSTSEGYTETTRPVWTPTTGANARYLDNLNDEAEYTIATASQLTVYGAAVVSSNVKGGTSGKLMAAAKFSTARQLFDTDTFRQAYRVEINPA